MSAAHRPSREDVEQQVEAFAAFLRTRQLRLTPEREQTARWVAQTSDHFEPDEIVSRLLKARRRVSRATIYRTLDLLREAGLVQRVELGDMGVRYERHLGREHHDHLACLGCGLLIEFSSPEIERLQDDVCRRNDFEAVRHQHRVMGYCRACRDAGRRP